MQTNQELITKANEEKLSGNYENAYSLYKEVFLQNSKSLPALTGLVFVSNVLGYFSEALSYANAALEIDKQCVSALSGKGYALNALEQFKEALEAYTKALEFDVNLAFGWNGKGNVLIHLEQYPEAIECFKKTKELNPPPAAISAIKRAQVKNPSYLLPEQGMEIAESFLKTPKFMRN